MEQGSEETNMNKKIIQLDWAKGIKPGASSGWGSRQKKRVQGK